MRRTFSLALAALAAVSYLPTASAGPSCTVPSQYAAEPVLDDVYYVRTAQSGYTQHVQLWRETNDIPGLQTVTYRCAAGDEWAADTLMASIPLAGGGAIPL